ncbi:MAG: hypothetical protein O9297_12220 [Flavobacterium sp.]|uniref:hypothetical protein n=1 Tax=Flavobacterium sp. TaxID=239 RepID=UPI0022C95C39|nr:hypothetical protein [Flavobacterium sp.]MCZ8297970.1 hypothetical protein [Flavobacterium sp.]
MKTTIFLVILWLVLGTTGCLMIIYKMKYANLFLAASVLTLGITFWLFIKNYFKKISEQKNKI